MGLIISIILIAIAFLFGKMRGKKSCVRRPKTGGASRIEPQFITPNVILTKDLYVLPINKLGSFTKEGDYHKYADQIYDVYKHKSKGIGDRLDTIKKLEKESKWVTFDHTKNIPKQFEKIFKNDPKMILFYYGNRKYQWRNPDDVYIVGTYKNKKVTFDGYGLESSPYELPKVTKAGTYRFYKDRVEETDEKETMMAGTVWKYMNEGLTKDSFLCKDMVLMRKYLRREGNNVVKALPEKSTVLDIGAGRAAYIHDIKNNQIDYYAVEPNKDYYKMLERKKTIYQFTSINKKGEDRKDIEKMMKGKKANILMMHSLTFFFKDPNTLQFLVDMLDDILDKGHSLSGVLIDGDKLKKKGEKIDCENIHLKIKGNNVHIHFDDPNSLVKDQDEYLIDFKLLVDKLKDKGIELKHDRFFKDTRFSECQNWWISLNREFKFIKK